MVVLLPALNDDGSAVMMVLNLLNILMIVAMVMFFHALVITMWHGVDVLSADGGRSQNESRGDHASYRCFHRTIPSSELSA